MILAIKLFSQTRQHMKQNSETTTLPAEVAALKGTLLFLPLQPTKGLKDVYLPSAYRVNFHTHTATYKPQYTRRSYPYSKGARCPRKGEGKCESGGHLGVGLGQSEGSVRDPISQRTPKRGLNTTQKQPQRPPDTKKSLKRCPG